MRQGSVNKIRDGLPAVIVAAGEGRRLRKASRGVPKPLTEAVGQTLLERTIRTCQAAGVSVCYVVTGYRGEEVGGHANDVGRRLGMEVQFIENPNWQAGNGTSVLAVAPFVRGPFLLLMSDVLLQPEILQMLVESRGETFSCAMAVDRRLGRVIDLEETVKVRIEGDQITALGSDIPIYDAAGTGLFLCESQES